ncbi:MAG: EmrB/QacA family drug resistance transporter [Aeromicrobium sp.]|jgi:EmrB/QacA subfamily drug resistance transporter|nr:EmrB/QacA family drug resistance transporter [Aeromicrobium sp.]
MQLSTESVASTPAQAPTELTHREIMEVLFGLLAALFTAILSSTIVSNALPTIIAELDGSQIQYTWVVTASLLAMTVSTPIWGKLSDLVNKKVLVQISIVVFVVGSVLAGLSRNLPELISMRVVQGVAMGGLTANAQSIIGSIIPPRQRGRYSGYMGATMAVATVSGPLLGGLIVDTPGLGWRWTFFVCVPLALISLVVLQKYLHIATVSRKVDFDYVGAVLIAIAASLPLLWVTFAGDSFDWLSWQSAAFIGGTVLASVLLVRVELRHPEPLLPIGVVRERTTALAIVGSIAVGIAMFGASVFIGQYFQVAGGRTPTEAGLLTIPLMLGSLFGTLLSGQLITRFGRWKRFLVIGSASLILGLGLLSTIDHRTPEWHAMTFIAFVGIGMGMLLQNYVLAVQNTVDVSQVGAASATVAFFRSLGGAVGVSVLGAILASQVKNDVTSKLAALGVDPASGGGSLLDVKNLPPEVAEIVRSAYGDATGTIFLVAACVAVLSLVAALLIREVPLRLTVRKDDADQA